MKNLLDRIKKTKFLEACQLAVMPTSSFSASRPTTANGLPEVWQMVGTCSMGIVTVYVIDAVVLTVAREFCEGQERPLKFHGHWLILEPKESHLAFYAVNIERPIIRTKRSRS
jgi:hypothetical protein